MFASILSVFLPLCLRFSSSLPPLFLFAYLLGLCLCCSLVILLHCLCGSLGVLLFPFPFRTASDIKRKGAPCWCVLSRPVVGCFIWLLLYIPRTRQVSARLYRNKVLEKGNLIECSKLFCVRRCSYLCSSKFVFLLFSYLLLLVGSYFLSPFRLLCRFRYYETIAGGFNS